ARHRERLGADVRGAPRTARGSELGVRARPLPRRRRNRFPARRVEDAPSPGPAGAAPVEGAELAGALPPGRRSRGAERHGPGVRRLFGRPPAAAAARILRARARRNAMCGIGGAISLDRRPVPQLGAALETMNSLLAHRGPDGEGTWSHPADVVGFAHRRLAIIDLVTGQQPMTDGAGNWITYNGEIYNYVELRSLLGESRFTTSSDTEVILRGYRQWDETVL